MAYEGLPVGDWKAPTGVGLPVAPDVHRESAFRFFGYGPDAFKAIFWWRGGYCTIAEVVLLDADGSFQQYRMDDNVEDDEGGCHGRARGDWVAGDSDNTYTLTYREFAWWGTLGGPTGDVEGKWLPCTAAAGWNVPTTVPVSAAAGATIELPTIVKAPTMSRRFQLGGRAQFGN